MHNKTNQQPNITREGMQSFHQHKGRYSNPYPSGSWQHNDFERGWTQALKRTPDALLKRYQLVK